jgi:hypothetical protein
MGLTPAGLNMNRCDPRMEIVRHLDLKSYFSRLHQNLKRFRGWTEKSICSLTYTGLCSRSLRERGNFSGNFNGWFRCRISRLCSDSWGTRSSLLIDLCKLGFIVD